MMTKRAIKKLKNNQDNLMMTNKARRVIRVNLIVQMMKNRLKNKNLNKMMDVNKKLAHALLDYKV